MQFPHKLLNCKSQNTIHAIEVIRGSMSIKFCKAQRSEVYWLCVGKVSFLTITRDKHYSLRLILVKKIPCGRRVIPPDPKICTLERS